MKFILIIAIFLLFYGCSEKVTDVDVDSHPAAWAEEDNNNFHGTYVLENGTRSCQTCHGELFDGGTSKVSCRTCHALYPHDPEFALLSSANFHGQFIRDNDWDLSECQSCHGESFNLPSTETSCLTCHTSPGGPIACNTCHGSMNNIAPPQDLSNNLETTFPGVGAHQLHLGVSEFTSNMGCTSCHVLDYDFYASAHIDGDNQVELVFDDLATNSGSVNPEYNFSNATCSNVYCHGNFVFLRDESDNSWAYNNDMVGNNPVVDWTVVDGSQISCGSCHDLPPEGHKPYSQSCHLCHSQVVDENFNIINKTLHINGEIDY